MGLTSARDTPRQESTRETATATATPTTPTPANLLDTLRKPNNTTSLKEHERVPHIAAG